MAVSNAVSRTEAIADAASGLDTKPDADILAALLDGQRRAVDAVAAAIPALSRAAQLGDHFRLAQNAGNARQRLQVIRACTLRCQQQEYQVNRFVIQRFEIHRGFQPREHAGDAGQGLELAVRYGNAVADTGGTQFLALHDRIENVAFVQAGDFGCLFGNFIAMFICANLKANFAARMLAMISRPDISD